MMKTNPEIIYSNNKFSVLDCEDKEEKEEDKEVSHTKEKKKKTNKTKKRQKNIKKIFQKKQVYESSENNFPDVIGCNRCFISHFPNKKFCRWTIGNSPRTVVISAEIDKKNKCAKLSVSSSLDINLINHIWIRINALSSYRKSSWLGTPLPRLRGGSNKESHEIPLIFSQAIASAKKHGIKLKPGKLNNAAGDCVFESTLNNINSRECFAVKFPLSPTVYRYNWMTHLESLTKNYPNLGAGFTAEEQKENWDYLKQSGNYDVDFFGDLVIHGIAIGCRKNILIINTSLEASSPVYVIRPEEFGGIRDSDVPIVLAYNQVHYESLHPVSNLDVEKTKLLVNSYIAGTYTFKREDIGFLISPTHISKDDLKSYSTSTQKLGKNMQKSDTYEGVTYHNAKYLNYVEEKGKEKEAKDIQEKISQLMKIKAKERPQSDKLLLKSLREKLRRLKQSEERKEKDKEKQRKRMERLRKAKSKDDRDIDRKKIKELVEKLRKTKSKTERDIDRKKQKESMDRLRKKGLRLKEILIE